ncbi:MAG: hypothetical protein IJ685_02150 [Selenomonadaceae bacterium]|nr:hypothetical protein [Selenomonadaceae bacterium]
MFGKFIGKIFFATLATVIFCSLNFCEAAKKTIAVMPLENVSGYSDQRIAEIMTEQLLVAIHSSGNYTVVERAQMGTVIKEQGFQNIAGDPNKSAESGKLSGAEYTLVGKVTMTVVEQNTAAKAVSTITRALKLNNLETAAGKFVNQFKSKVKLEIRFVDSKTGEVVIAKTIEGNKSGATQAEALNAACKDAAENFLRELDTINPFRARIAEVSGEDVYIDRGSQDGLRKGETLVVAREGAPIVVNGKVVAVKQTVVGKIKVIEVNSDYAVCKKESSEIHKGDVVKRG